MIVHRPHSPTGLAATRPSDRRRTLPALRRLVNEVDPEAFMVVQDVRQVLGRGFEALPPPKPLRAAMVKKAS